MFRNRVWLLGVVLGLSMFVLTAPASAWEFTMTGTYTWDYEYITQLGRAGFFGPFDVDNRAAGVANLNTANAWLGYQPNNLVQIPNLATPTANQNVQQQGSVIVSGEDASWNKMWMDVNMEVRINQAVRVRGLYHIGEWATGTQVFSVAGSLGTQNTDGFQTAGGELVQSEYQNFRYPGVKRSFSPGNWNTLWLTAQLPWGELAIGKRPSSWGTGLMWDGADSRSSEQLTLFAIYGPLRIGAGFYPSRTGSEGFADEVFDKTGVRQFDFTFPNIIYRNGPLDAGIQFDWVRRHRGGDRRNDVNTNNSKRRDFRDRNDLYGGVYVKYNNGRFFYNAELDWYDRLDRQGRQASFGVAAPFPNGATVSSDFYMQHWRVMTELGVLCGPSKLSLLYSWSAGNDRRGRIPNSISGGISNINQGTLVEPTNFVSGGIVQSTSNSNTSVYRPYSYLMVYSYGLGTHINGDTGNGYVEDASCYAARLDYAVAANLNVYGSFFWADRVGNAYGWGFLKPINTGANNPAAINSGYAVVAGTLTGAPTIPNNNLGWEVDTGFDWKLLQGLTLNAVFAYWQPGKWFNFACIDKNVPAWDTPTVGNNFGINPNRSIDAIWSMDMRVVGEF